MNILIITMKKILIIETPIKNSKIFNADTELLKDELN